jgi:type II secretion system protein H
MKPRSKPAGFTLIEVLLVVSLVAIVATFALPSFRGVWRNVRAQRTVERFAYTLHRARTESLMRQVPVRIVVDPDRRAFHSEILSKDAVTRSQIPEPLAAHWASGDFDTGDMEILSPSSPLVFLPSGTSTGAAYEIIAGPAWRMSVKVSILDANIIVENVTRTSE